MRFINLLLACLLIASGRAQASADDKDTQNRAGFLCSQKDPAQRELHLERLRNALDCAANGSLQHCRDVVAAAGAVAVGALGVAASLRAGIIDLCEKPVAGLFEKSAWAAPLNCGFDRQLSAQTQADTQKLRAVAEKDAKDVAKKVQADLERAKTELTAAREALHRQSPETKFLESISKENLSKQGELIQNKVKEMPNLKDVLTKLRAVRGLQTQSSYYAMLAGRLRLAKSAEQIADITSGDITGRLYGANYLSKESSHAVINLSMYGPAIKSAMAGDAKAMTRQGVTALGRLTTQLLDQSVVDAAFRSGLRIVVGGPLGLLVQGLAHADEAGAKDEFARATPCADFTNSHKTEIAPGLGPNALSCLFEPGRSADLQTSLNNQSSFCSIMQNVEDTVGPRGWKAQCLPGGRFKLTSVSEDSSQSTTMTFDTNSQGKLTRMIFAGPFIASDPQQLGGPLDSDDDALRSIAEKSDNADFVNNHFAVVFDDNEEPKSILTVTDSSKRTANFDDPKSYKARPAGPLLNGGIFQKNNIIAGDVQTYKNALLVVAEVQMCATPTDANVSERCKMWGASCQGASAHQSNSSVK